MESLTRMTSTANPTAIFQNYIQNVFKFPKEIKNDIVYCQRALKAHIKVHQMVLDIYKMQGNPNPTEKQRITDELESQIYEINAEQQYLLLRLRRIISEFNKYLERKGVHVVPHLMNEHISSVIVPLINDQNFLVYPTSVRFRSTEEKLIEKYFEMKKGDETPSNDYFEILDSNDDDDDDEEKEEKEKEERTKPSYKPIYKNISSKKVNNELENEKISLLKSMGEHPAAGGSKPCTSQFVEVGSEMISGKSNGFSAITSNITVSTLNKKSEPSAAGRVSTHKRKSDPTAGCVYPISISAASNDLIENDDDMSVSQNVKMSRLNLRQVLKNVQSENLAAKASANHLKPVTSQSVQSPVLNTISATKNVENNPKVVTLNSSSDESTPEGCLALKEKNSQFPIENIDTRMTADEYGQEMFLRIFGLFTPEMHLQMQQRRSKRKRRTVQSNARSDYHYGHIEYRNLAPVEEKKKRKEFLLSPQVKRKQGRPPKQRNVEIIEKSDETTSRSGSSSPDDKRSCNQCMKVGGSLTNCESCKRYYHPSCHLNADKLNHSIKAKICPPCRRKKSMNETHHQKTSLKTSADKLKHRLTSEKSRRKTLQQKSESFKMQMSALFNIIKAIKNERNSCFE